MVKLQPIDKCPSSTIDTKMQKNKANVNKYCAVFVKVGLMWVSFNKNNWINEKKKRQN